MSTPSSAAIVEMHVEVRITGAIPAVWKALTNDIGAWWPEEFYAGGEPEKRRYYLETKPGGRMYEAWDGGGGVLWGTVVAVEPERRLQVMGTTFPNWGGPSFWFGTWELEADGTVTMLRFSESTVGRVSDSLAEQKEKGWRFLFGEALKAHVEGKPVPTWQD